jgi:phosphotransferase system HPr (HPr) family protein
MAKTQIIVTHEVGLHARPASLFVQEAKKYNAAIKVKNVTTKSAPVSAKSILGILTLGVLQNHEIQIETEGEDAEVALARLRRLIESNFGEGG